MNTRVLPALIIGIFFALGCFLLKDTQTPKDRFQIISTGNFAIVLLDTYSGRIVTSDSQGKQRWITNASPLIFPEKEKISASQIAKWRKEGYSDGQIFDTVCLNSNEQSNSNVARELYDKGLSETQILNLYKK
jgi:hypothetical protein